MLLCTSKKLLICSTLLYAMQCASAQLLGWAPCAVSCITEVTAPVQSCQQGYRCFCTDQSLYNEAINCWQRTCTVREALTSQNITSATCLFPDRDIGPSGTAVAFVSVSVSLVLVGMQLLVLRLSHAWGWEDVLIGVGTLMMISNVICNPVARSFGFGKDAWRIPFDHTASMLQIFYIAGIFYVLGVAVTKMAFLCFYIRLFPTPRARRIAYPLLVLTFTEGSIFVFLFTFQCRPVKFTWLRWDGEAEGKCLDLEIGGAIHAFMNIALDLAIFTLPIFQIRSLTLSKKKRWQVLIMFAVGFFVTLVSVIRIPSVIAVSKSRNLSRDYIPLVYWSDLELNIGIACFCMPAARVVIRRYLPGFGPANTGHDESDEAIRATIGSSNAGAIHKKKVAHGKMVDVISNDETGRIVTYDTDSMNITEPGGSTLVSGGSRHGDTSWPLPHARTTSRDGEDTLVKFKDPVAKMSKSHTYYHSHGLASSSSTQSS